jgi:hypothetical protein
MMILEPNAAVGDMLSVNTIGCFKKHKIDYAKGKKVNTARLSV